MCDTSKEFSYGRCFSIIYRHGKTINDRMIRKFQLSGTQGRYLRRVFENPGISQEDLAKFYQVDKGSIAKSVRRMEDLGYIRREQNPEDRRAYCLFPTEKAQKFCEFCKEDIRRMERTFEESLTEEEVEMFKRLLIRITDNMKKYIEEEKSL